jgi:hypothetical protein
MTGPVVTTSPTQVRHPWRATARTLFAGVIALASLLPTIALAAHVDTVPAVAQVLAVLGTVTRVLAMPGVDKFLRDFVPWLATSPPPPEPVRQT